MTDPTTVEITGVIGSPYYVTDQRGGQEGARKVALVVNVVGEAEPVLLVMAEPVAHNLGHLFTTGHSPA